eukprot:CAMPEP_0171099248 /NCGR_PEP_ID=MMETSP0766_2-20121228/50896_1 /TAXON_ID=439317 /ORGANISM="Gambierdiscus australes, Strain CAWD 149" /LENGTH=261 /DNA_ID=CAMNT_0011558825 /DNA_START=51 /DNA_END=836 /DNA_ORIENTATION=-
MAVAVIRWSCLCVAWLGFAGSAHDDPGRFDDMHSLVQRAEARLLHPKRVVDKKAEQATRKQLQEQATAILKRIKGFPPLLLGPARDLIVPKFMELRRKSDPPTQTVMDGVIGMNLLERNMSDLKLLVETLNQLSGVFDHADVAAAASALHNASILIPAIAKATPKLVEMDRSTKAELARKLKPVFSSFNQDISPYMKTLGSDVRREVNETMQEIGPRAKVVLPKALGIINQTIWDALLQLRVGEEFGTLRHAVKLVLGKGL